MADNYWNYQELHGAFMKNHTGSSLTEIHSILVIPIGIFILKVLLLLSLPRFAQIHWAIRFLVEFTLVVVPQLATLTCASKHSHVTGTRLVEHVSIVMQSLFDTQWATRLTNSVPCVCLLTGAVVSVVILAVLIAAAIRYARIRNSKRIEKHFHRTQTFVTTFRSGTLLLTIICILAVDFDVFPRTFAKTEVYGTSLMDMGVGMFVITNAIVSVEARQPKHKKETLSTRLYGVILSTLPLLILGFGRLVVIKALNYHENTSEYGTHWNFFFTLTAIKISSSLIFSVFRLHLAPYLAVFLIVSYQILLTVFNLSTYIIGGSAVDRGFLYENRSGIFSCIGFLSLYLVGVAVGRVVFVNQRLKLKQVFSLIFRLLVVLFLSLLLLVVSNHVEPVSRRFANFGYFLSVTSISCFNLALLVSLDLSAAVLTLNQTKFKDETYFGSLLLRALSSHGLAVFLLANVTTGVINLSLKTIYASSSTSMQILVCYVLFVISVSYYLQSRKITTKKW